MEQFYEETETKRDSKEQFRQREIQKLDQKYNFLMFHTKMRGGKAFAAEQKIRELKILQKSKRIHKPSLTKKNKPKKTNPMCN